MDWSTDYGAGSRNTPGNTGAKAELIDKNGLVFYTVTSPPGSTAEQRIRSGHTSNKVVGGWKPCTSYVRVSRTTSVKYADFRVVRASSGRTVRRCYGYATKFADTGTSYGSRYRDDPVDFPRDSAAENSAAVECLEELKDGKAELGLALAGSVKAYEGLLGTFTRSVEFLLAVKRGRFAPALTKILNVEDSRAIARDWLKFQYHWRPLASDVYDAYNLLGFKLAVPNQHCSAYGSTRVEQTGQIRTKQYGYYFRTEDWKARVTYACKLWAKIDSSILHAAAQTGLSNPASIAWDVLPWSFAIDWLIPVGRTIGILDAARGMSFLDGYTVRRGVMSAVGSTLVFGLDDGDVPLGKFPYSVRKDVYRRTKLGGFPHPLPYIKNPFSLEHGANALALFTTLRRR